MDFSWSLDFGIWNFFHRSWELRYSTETRWHKLDSRNYRGKVGGVTEEEIVKDAVLVRDAAFHPLHDWAVEIGNGTYGLMQFRESCCQIWFGKCVMVLPFPAPVVAFGLLLILLLLLIAAWHFIGNLRHRDAPGDA